jgi:hypothetical protein
VLSRIPSDIGIEVYFFGGECSLINFARVVVDDAHFQFFASLLEFFDGLLAVLGLEGGLLLDHFALGQLVLLAVHEISAELWLWPGRGRRRGRQFLATGCCGQFALRFHHYLNLEVIIIAEAFDGHDE